MLNPEDLLDECSEWIVSVPSPIKDRVYITTSVPSKPYWGLNPWTLWARSVQRERESRIFWDNLKPRFPAEWKEYWK